MRITRESLIEIARDTAAKRTLSDHTLVAAYLTGSLRTDQPFLGNSTDIDLVFVHTGEPKVRREILPVTAAVHLDIRHNARSEFEKPKELRVHPWLGPELYDPLPLHVTEHFFEYVQAGVREKYHETASYLARSRTVARSARQFWKDLQISQASSQEKTLAYLATLQQAANAVALLTGDPLSERRFLLQFPDRAAAAGQPDFTTRLLYLLGATRLDAPTIAGFLPEWEKAFVEAAHNPMIEKRISAPRLGYYKLAFESLLAGETPLAVAWPLILTWTISVCVLPPKWKDPWQAASVKMELEGKALKEKIEGLDLFLDSLEELLEKVAASPDI